MRVDLLDDSLARRRRRQLRGAAVLLAFVVLLGAWYLSLPAGTP